MGLACLQVTSNSRPNIRITRLIAHNIQLYSGRVEIRLQPNLGVLTLTRTGRATLAIPAVYIPNCITGVVACSRYIDVTICTYVWVTYRICQRRANSGATPVPSRGVGMDDAADEVTISRRRTYDTL